LPTSQKAGCVAPHHLVGDEVSPLWEWLPATIIAARCRSHKKNSTLIEPKVVKTKKVLNGLIHVFRNVL
jgi:hypothetical protein